MAEKEKFLVRDVFNEEGIKLMASAIKKNYPEFKSNQFVKETAGKFPELSFIQRSDHITEMLRKYLPDDFPRSAAILLDSLGPAIPQNDLKGFGGFIVWPMTIYISRYGLEYFDISVNALYEMTKRFTAESAIRYFIIRYPEKTLKVLEKWVTDPNPHVRRLVSEGTRPRLPWAVRLQQFVKDPLPVIHLLEKLKEDPELFVRRSVANNINDIAKDHPDRAAALLIKWNKSKNAGTKWIVQHASRTLVKAGHTDILSALGFDNDVEILVDKLKLKKPAVHFGETLTFSFSVKNNSESAIHLMIDYIIHHRKANGGTTPKVFKLAKKEIPAHGEILLQKNHPIREISTRKYYPGEHIVEIQINGKKYLQKKFALVM